ncbi:hypothetical protein ACPF4W_003252 [Vibrio cholerae]|uniref:hypothetical protein n=1 Tax=Vibrio paracholerae TaxID=650003 RepID=UPI0002C17683|nr:hypothetical protein [Vibrio paracholerae]EMP83436.1 hypothetical protein VC87395_003746 [Vibrio paracholerae 87395]
MANNKLPEFLWLSKKIAVYKDEIQDETRIKNALHRLEVGLSSLNLDFGDEESQSIRISITGVHYSNKPLPESIIDAANDKGMEVNTFLKGIFNEIYNNWRVYGLDRNEEFSKTKEQELLNIALDTAKFIALGSFASFDFENTAHDAILARELKSQQEDSLLALSKSELMKQLPNNVTSNLETALNLSRSISSSVDKEEMSRLAERMLDHLSVVSEALEVK